MINNINNLAATLNTGVLGSSDDKITTAETSVPVSSSSRRTADGIVLNISSEGREKLAKENKELGKELAQQLHDKTNNTAKEAEKTNEKDPVDKLISDIQQQIDEIKEKLQALENDESEEAVEQRKALEAQLTSLNGTLMELIGKKMNEVKAPA